MAETKPKLSPPTSRLGRLARLAGLAPRAIPFAVEGAKRALGGDRTEDEEAAARVRMQAEMKKTAEAMLKTLGEMKGLPLKLGQMASYIDGLAPPGYEERFQATLKKLLDKAPPLSPEAAVQQVTAELGAPPEEIFATWEAEPFAAASIGQVHRATTKDGQRVAVKVQYPGIDKAIENDLKSVTLLEQMVAPISRKLNGKQTIDELRTVFMSELDYAREAEMADVFRRINADDPSVYVPRVHHALTTRRVLTLEMIDGIGYAELCAGDDQARKNSAGATIWRFTFRSMLRYGMLYADPHPGNYRFLPDGRVAFLDFGCVKELSPEAVAGMKRYMRAALDGDWDEFDRALVEELGYDPKDPTWDLYRSYTMELMVPLRSNELWRCSPEKAREHVQYLTRGLRDMARSKGGIPSLPYIPRMPQDFTFVNRLQWGLASVLAGLHTEAAFRPLIEPWVRSELLPVPA
jgi:predicted unusual protein kinase regulating ubiquinone biosynthesis (AarF/ABC1/UbiB family)